MDRTKLGYIAGGVSIFVNILLFILKYWAGIVTGSIALTADAWHTLSDSISSIVVIIAVKLSSKKADKDHPFGHGRWEQIAAMFIGFILVIIAWSFLSSSIEMFRSQESAKFGTLAIVVTIISIFAKEGLAQYSFYVARKTGNISIKADGWHHRSDSLSSVVVLIGIFFSGMFWWIDSVLGIIISIMLFYATFHIVKESINKLLGEEPTEELIDRIKEIVKLVYPEETDAHHFHIHNYNSHQELTFHVRLDPTLDIAAAHLIVTEIEKSILDNTGINATIHIEPLGYKHP